MSRVKSRGYVKRDKPGTNVRQTGRTGHSLESCPTVPCPSDVWSDATFQVISDHDMKAWEMDCKWGTDNLQELVDQELGRKFVAQQEMYRKALRSNNELSIQKHGRAMVKAFDVLDRDAVKQGARGIEPKDYWSYDMNGIEVRLVKTNAEMPRKKDDGVAYLSVPELMKFVPPGVFEIKETFAGSKVKDMIIGDNDELI